MGIADILGEIGRSKAVSTLAAAIEDGQTPIQLRGLIGSADVLVALACHHRLGGDALFILPDHEEASYFLSDLENSSGKPALFFPSSYRKAFDFTQTDSAHVLQRAETLSELYKNPEKKSQSRFVVTYPEALAEKVLSRSDLSDNTLIITQDSKLDISFINEFLSEYDFERVDFVYEPGQYAIRGGIVDIFSFSNELPYRIEFFGDQIERIRTFDLESQLSVQEIQTVTIVPNVQAKFLSENNISLLEYIAPNTKIWVKDIQSLADIAQAGFQKALELWTALQSDAKDLDPEWIDPRQTFTHHQYLLSLLRDLTVIEFGKQFLYKDAFQIPFDQKPQPSFNKDFGLLAHNLQENQKNSIQNFIWSDSPKQVERLFSILEDMQHQVEFTPIHVGLRAGFVDRDLKLACYTDHQIFDRYYKYKRKKGYEKSQAITLKELRDLKPGDYITHIDHGVGKYAGLEKIDVQGKTQEMIRLVYADHDLLYVNINSLNRISKYSGKEGAVPKMNKLGTDTWEKLKRTTKKKVKDIARDLIKLYAKRKAQTGNAFSPDSYLQNELEASFIYEDTPDQEKATADVKKDMESPHPMDRLICGDVGFGKTEIAIRAAFKAVADNKQVAILVPTTILAHQHFRTFTERLEGFPCNIDYINRFKTTKQIKETLGRLASGELDIIIGTHRLVSKDVKFKDLGLMIIDEEQKFGVTVKEKLKQMRANVDCLTLTATPIPRTLHFSLMGARDLSIISTPPPNRQPVQTELHVFNETLIQEAVSEELERGGQVFFIHNRVADLPQLGEMIRRLVPHARIGVAHGQLEGDALEDVMLKFINHEYDVLVATTIIEAGLDIPNANTIIINHAHMFGLSDLHQMRGRVGRTNKKAFCYLLSPPISTLTPEAYKRLSAIEEFSDLGSGFNVAMRDLDIRGSGNLLGAEQSGFIAEIGFEMYHKILDEAIHELKEDEFKGLFPEEKEPQYVSFTQIDTDIEVLIPDEYVTHISERYNLYSELSNLENEQELDQFRAALIDRFGPIPLEVHHLFDTLRMQWLGRQIGFEKISFKKGLLRGYFITKKESAYFDSEAFGRVLMFAQQNPTISNLKEVRGTLRIAVSGVSDSRMALEILREMAGEAVHH